MLHYHAPWWLPGGNAQTIWAARLARRYQGSAPVYLRERWSSPDHDFIDVDWLQVEKAPPASAPLLVLFHGLEGSSASHYAQAFADYAAKRQLHYAVPHFRGCSGELNLAPRAYHSGDHAEIGWILQRFASRHPGPVMAVGISLGGNALMRWAGEVQEDARSSVQVIASVSAPLDLAASGRAIGRGFNRMVYTRMFLETMKPRALQKLQQYPGLFDRQALLQSGDLYTFDNIFTAPLHGFRNTEDYWARASAKPHLGGIRVPALVLNACNDPFVPASSLPAETGVSREVTLWQPRQGGHVGFPSGRWPGHVGALPAQVGGWLLRQLG
jgi:predicted alpha/beta-fold hydrolase